MKSNLRWILGILGGLIVLTITLSLLNKRAPDQVFRIGVILPETGVLAEMGQFERRAMELAERGLHEKGEGIKLTFEDGRGDNKSAAAAATKLIEVDGVNLLIVSTTGAAQTAQPIADRHQVPMLAFAMASDIAPKSPTTVRFYIGIEEESRALVEALKHLPRDTRLGVLHANVSVWPVAIETIYRPFFREHFSREPVVEQYDFKSKDFRPQLTKLKVEGVTSLVLLGYGFEYPEMFRQISELGIRERLKLYGGWGFLYSGLPADQLEGIHVAGPEYVFAKPTTGEQFERLYSSAFGTTPNFDAAFAYEAVRFAPTVRDLLAKGTTTGLKRSLVEGGQYEGAMGTFRFGSEGNMVVKTGIGVYRGGRLVSE